ncbi:Chaperone_protein DnaJ [Hexamita inflata]|uniref:Chaperone protein DnaJ n=1 Tax=Hexamita inflata TaxID=28002 RepID=A0AA86TGH9_9EUKA|nr:Chaperone protein DnaJ [Hexamita inflata]
MSQKEYQMIVIKNVSQQALIDIKCVLPNGIIASYFDGNVYVFNDSVINKLQLKFPQYNMEINPSNKKLFKLSHQYQSELNWNCFKKLNPKANKMLVTVSSQIIQGDYASVNMFTFYTYCSDLKQYLLPSYNAKLTVPEQYSKKVPSEFKNVITQKESKGNGSKRIYYEFLSSTELISALFTRPTIEHFQFTFKQQSQYEKEKQEERDYYEQKFKHQEEFQRQQYQRQYEQQRRFEQEEYEEKMRQKTKEQEQIRKEQQRRKQEEYEKMYQDMFQTRQSQNQTPKTGTNDTPQTPLQLYTKYFNQAKNNYDNKVYQDAIDQLDLALKYQQTQDAYQLKAFSNYNLKQYQQALEDALKCYRYDISNEESSQLYAKCLLKNGKPNESLTYANKSFEDQKTSKNREFLVKVQRSIDLIGDSEMSFWFKIKYATVQTSLIFATAFEYLLNFNYSTMSSKERIETIDKHDQFYQQQFQLIHYLQSIAEQLNEFCKPLVNDYLFIQQEMPLYEINPVYLTYYFILMHVISTLNLSFEHNQINLLNLEHNDNKQNFIDQCRLKLPKNSNDYKVQTILACCNLLDYNNMSDIQSICASNTNLQNIVKTLELIKTLDQEGLQIFNSDKNCSAQKFSQARNLIIQQLKTDNQNPFSSIIVLSLTKSIARFCFNEGLCYTDISKQIQCYNLVIFVNNMHCKAHEQLSNIYLSKEMYQEAEKSLCVIANNIVNEKIILCRKYIKKYVLDHRSILNIDITVEPDSEQFNKAYKKACTKWHPDRFNNDPTKKKFAETKFKQIQEARSMLLNSKGVK